MVGILRIISGKYGGRYIKAPEGDKTRPTSQVAREALFNVLASRIAGALFIDMFAGSGAVGIEALSRGAGKVIFVDISRDCGALIRDNLKLLGAGTRETLVLAADIAKPDSFKEIREGIKRLGEAAADLIFADPPYSFEGVGSLPASIAGSSLCAADAMIIIEHGKKIAVPQRAGDFELIRSRQYGDSIMSFYGGLPEDYQY